MRRQERGEKHLQLLLEKTLVTYCNKTLIGKGCN